MFHVKHSELMEKEEFLNRIFNEAGCSLTVWQCQALERYANMLQEWNRKFNLTAITEFEEIAVRHYLDSAAPLFRNSEAVGGRLIDVGSGAGFPGLVLKILKPELEVVLADSLQKRIGFLQAVIDALQLTGIRAVHGRAEDLARQKEFRDAFDLSAARAVAPLSVLAEWCLPFVKPGGMFLAYKTESAPDEIEQASGAIDKLCGKTEKCDLFELPGTEYKRSLVWIRKNRPTPAIYPRKAGAASKKPL